MIDNPFRTLKQAIDEYLQWMLSNGYSFRTCDTYRNESITTPKKGGLMATLKGSNLFPQFTLIQFVILVLLMFDITPYLVFV